MIRCEPDRKYRQGKAFACCRSLNSGLPADSRRFTLSAGQNRCRAGIRILPAAALLLCLALPVFPDRGGQLMEKIMAGLAAYADYRVEIRETSRISGPAGRKTTASTALVTVKGQLLLADNTQLSGGR
jgi:hypothetical protein